MKMAWIDATNGAAGDMLLAALIDAGADVQTVRDGLARLSTEPISLRDHDVRRHGLRAKRIEVLAPDSATQRHLADVIAIIEGSGLPPPVVEFATRVFTRLAEAEAAVHGTEPAGVHFHEVGALDAIADIVGCAIALDCLDLLQAPIIVSPVAVGQGRVRTAHGPLPVPAPAVLELLTQAGVRIQPHEAEFELCTPTGAALLATMATAHGGLPACSPLHVGTGAGSADPHSHANVVRILIGESPAGPGPLVAAPMLQVETTIDDLDPRLWPDVLAAMREAGAADAWCTPVLMHKGRPGHVLTVLVSPHYLDGLTNAIFRHTSTLGLRIQRLERRVLPRDQVKVQYGQAEIGVKRGLLDGRPVTVQPEYEEVRAAARATGQPVRSVMAEVQAAAVPDGPSHRDREL